jgi:hypothetical protein
MHECGELLQDVVTDLGSYAHGSVRCGCCTIPIFTRGTDRRGSHLAPHEPRAV